MSFFLLFLYANLHNLTIKRTIYVAPDSSRIALLTAPPEPEKKKMPRGLSSRERHIELLQKQLEEDSGPIVVKLGDASIASPFTSKRSSVQSVCHIIRQGRCTLMTTLQMFKILALNCLLNSFCLSVLYLDNVKYSDNQMTIQGIPDFPRTAFISV